MKEQDIKKYFDRMAPERDKWKKKSRYYYSHIENFISFLVPENKRVVEIGCGTGDLLFKLKPSYGLGVDISEKMIELARQKNSNPKIEFKVGTIDDIEGLFDYIILSDLIGYLPDIEELFRKLSRIMHPQKQTHYYPIQPAVGAGVKPCFKCRIKNAFFVCSKLD